MWLVQILSTSGSPAIVFSLMPVHLGGVTVVRIDSVKGVTLTAVNILHHGEVETAKQVSAKGVRIGQPAIRRDLNHAGDALGQVRNKVVCVAVIPFAGQMEIIGFVRRSRARNL